MKFERLISLFEATQAELRERAARSVDASLVVRNWLFGWYIVEYEQSGLDRAEYGERLIATLSERLGDALGRGYSKRNLEQWRKFYLQRGEIAQTVSAELADGELARDSAIAQTSAASRISLADLDLQAATQAFSLSWSHYVTLLTIDDEQERRFYEIEAAANDWSVRELKRQLASSLYERLALSRDKAEIRRLATEGQVVEKAADLLKNPMVLEFLELEERETYSETELESALIDRLEQFLLELGKGFLFEARQKRFTFDDDHFYVDLVFYNRLLRCYVLIDLKRDKLTHQDLGQMQMYVNYFDRYVKLDDEAPTVGIVLCHRKNDALVELTLPANANVFATKYQLYLPSKEELRCKLNEWVEAER